MASRRGRYHAGIARGSTPTRLCLVAEAETPVANFKSQKIRAASEVSRYRRLLHYVVASRVSRSARLPEGFTSHKIMYGVGFEMR